MVQDLYFEVCRKKTHIFLDAKETNTVKDLKLMVEGILRISIDRIELIKFDEDGNKSTLDEAATLGESGFSPANAKAQNPAVLGLRVKGEDEALIIDDVSVPPPIPESMRPEAPAADQ